MRLRKKKEDDSPEQPEPDQEAPINKEPKAKLIWGEEELYYMGLAMFKEMQEIKQILKDIKDQ